MLGKDLGGYYTKGVDDATNPSQEPTPSPTPGPNDQEVYMSNNIIVNNLKVDELKCVKSSSYILMRKLGTPNPIRIFDKPKVIEYFNRIKKYNREKIYDEKTKKLYANSQIKIDGIS